ncbi:galanin receptor type 2-like [Dendronephthya gigantea]|uniref:galanin receptor type 2-like n=1 Tax=Dendronephthya gigantea TaxID=151771 RepID=UPI00106C92CD|nr:galanin receptor type 2-like [Dendronephthya gigantea]
MASIIPSVIFTSVTTGEDERKDDGNHPERIMRAICAIISIGSIVPNVLFLMAMLCKYSRIRAGHHNILLYNLIISDILAGMAISITPKLIPSETFVNSPRGLARDIYCRLLWSQFMVFLFGVVSVYTVVFLTAERWVAVHYPFKYRTTMSSTKAKICVLFIWLLGLLSNTPHLTEISPNDNDGMEPCHWKYKDYQIRQIVAFLEITLKFIAPSLILVLVLFSLYKKFHHLNPVTCTTRPDREKQLLRMCAATSFTVLLCWSPNQVYYLLYKFNVVSIGTTWHRITVALALSTSAINPMIYCIASTTYRTCLKLFLREIFGKCTSGAHSTQTFPLAEMRYPNLSRQQTFDTPFFIRRGNEQANGVSTSLQVT